MESLSGQIKHSESSSKDRVAGRKLDWGSVMTDEMQNEVEHTWPHRTSNGSVRNGELSEVFYCLFFIL